MSTPPPTMKVLLDARMAGWSGVGRYTKGLARALARREDVALTLLVGAERFAINDAANPITALTAHASPLSLTGARQFAAAVESAGVDITHCAHFPTPWPAPHPLVVTLHDVTPLVVDSVMPSALRRMAYRAYNRRATKVADAIVVPSRHTQGDVERLFPAARGKVHLTVEAADDFSAGTMGQMPPGLVRADERYVFTMGNTKAHKDLPTLISAFNEVGKRDPKLRLLLAGSGDDNYLDVFASDSVRDRVQFTGRVDDAQLRALYAGAAVFAFPSRYEGFGLPPLEAMSLGAPVVAADAASVPEVTGDAALLVPSGDVKAFAAALKSVLDDAQVAARLSAAGRERAAVFTWDATAAATVDAYKSVMRAARP